MRQNGFLPCSTRSVWVGPLLGLVLGAIVLSTHMDLAWNVRRIAEEARSNPIILGTILIVYIALIATPFVPGAEIGLLLLALFGASIAVPVYLATVVALTLSFSFGQLMPRVKSPRLKIPTSNSSEVSEIPGTHPITINSYSCLKAPLMRFRWFAVIILINMPGNTVLGGGVGIAMAAGNSRTFSTWEFLLCIGVAVAPVPTAVLLAEHFDGGAMVACWLLAVTDPIGSMLGNR